MKLESTEVLPLNSLYFSMCRIGDCCPYSTNSRAPVCGHAAGMVQGCMRHEAPHLTKPTGCVRAHLSYVYSLSPTPFCCLGKTDNMSLSWDPAGHSVTTGSLLTCPEVPLEVKARAVPHCWREIHQGLAPHGAGQSEPRCLAAQEGLPLLAWELSS